MGIGPHDDGNSIADAPRHQNDGIAQLNTERNVAVPKIVDTNVRQIGYLGAAGQFFVKGCGISAPAVCGSGSPFRIAI